LKNIALKQLLPPLVFYFIKTKDLLENVPIMKPSYTIEKLSPYLNIENYLGENEDPSILFWLCFYSANKK
jgi:hypothetical protein